MYNITLIKYSAYTTVSHASELFRESSMSADWLPTDTSSVQKCASCSSTRSELHQLPHTISKHSVESLQCQHKNVGSSPHTTWSNSTSPILRAHHSPDPRRKKRKYLKRFIKNQTLSFLPSTSRLPSTVLRYYPVQLHARLLQYCENTRILKRYTKQRLSLTPTVGGIGEEECLLCDPMLGQSATRKGAGEKYKDDGWDGQKKTHY